MFFFDKVNIAVKFAPSFRICSLIVKSSGLSLVPKAFGTSSCILWIYNPATYPVVKKISLFRITNPHSTEGGMTYPADHVTNFAHLSSTSVCTETSPNYCTNLSLTGCDCNWLRRTLFHTQQASFFAHLFSITMWSADILFIYPITHKYSNANYYCLITFTNSLFLPFSSWSM